MAENVSVVLPPDQFLPAPGQGALAIEIRSNDKELEEIVRTINDRSARITSETERRVLAATHGGCSIPLGTYSRITGDEITVDAVIASIDGAQYIKRSMTCNLADAEINADNLAQELLAGGGKEILNELRDNKKG